MNKLWVNKLCKPQLIKSTWIHWTPVSFMRSRDGALFVQEFQDIPFYMN